MLLFEDYNNLQTIGSSVTNISIWANWTDIKRYIKWINTKGFHFGGIILIWTSTDGKHNKVLLDGYRSEQGISNLFMLRSSISCIKFYSELVNLNQISRRMLMTAAIPNSLVQCIESGRRFKLPLKAPDVSSNIHLDPYCLLIDENEFSTFEDIITLHNFTANPCLICFKVKYPELIKQYLETLETNNLQYNGLAFYLQRDIYLYASTIKPKLHPYDTFKAKRFIETDTRRSNTNIYHKKSTAQDILYHTLNEQISISYFDIQNINKKNIKSATIFPNWYQPNYLKTPTLNYRSSTSEFEEIEL